MRVLLVDDDVDSVEAIRLLVSNAGHETELAHSGPSALRIAIGFCPEAAVLDLHMPGMDGYALGYRLKALKTLRPGGLVGMSGTRPEELHLHRFASPFDYFFQKPVQASKLVSLLALIEGSKGLGVKSSIVDLIEPASFMTL